MVRIGWPIAVLVCAGHAAAAPYTLVSLAQPAASAPLDRAQVTPVGSGTPVVWDLLLNDRSAPVGDVCAVVGDRAQARGPERAVDPALILHQLQLRGVCRGDAG